MDTEPKLTRHGHVACGATRKNRPGWFCSNRAGQGTDHVGFGNCKLHGGSTPNGAKHGQGEQVADAARKASARFGIPSHVDLHTALEEELHRTHGLIGWYVAEIQKLEVEKLYVAVGGAQGGVAEQKMHAYVAALHQERRQLVVIAKTCHDVGIDDRRIELAEQQGALIGQVLQGVLRDLGVLDRPGTSEVVRRHLTLVAGQA